MNKTIKIELTLAQLARLQALVESEAARHETTLRQVSPHIVDTTIELKDLLLDARLEINRDLGIGQQ